jgi:hypothetical protein
MTNKNSLCFKSQNVPTGVSDCHNIISTDIKGEVLHEPKNLIIEVTRLLILKISMMI